MAMTLLTTNTHAGDSDAASSFTSDIDSTYKLYIFKFINIHPETQSNFVFQVNVAGESSYNESIQATYFSARHRDNGGDPGVSYSTSKDQAAGTSFNILAPDIGAGSDESCSGTLWLFDPSNTTYLTHWYSRVQDLNQGGDYAMDVFTSGYFNVTGAVDEVQFKMVSDAINGTIKMYGVG